MQAKQTKTAKISIRLESEVRDVLEKLAEAEDKSLSNFIRSELKKIALRESDKKNSNDNGG